MGSKTSMLIDIQGEVRVDMLGLQAEVQLKVDKVGFDLYVSATLWGLFKATVEMNWGWDLSYPNIHFKAAVEIGSLSDIVSKVGNFITGMLDKAEEFMRAVEGKFNEAQGFINNVCDSLESTGNINGAAKAACKVASFAASHVLKGFFKVAQSLLSVAKTAIKGFIKAATFGFSALESFFWINKLSFAAGIDGSFSKSYVKGSLEYTFCGKARSFDGTIDVDDIAGLAWKKIKESFWQIRQVVDLAKNKFNSVKNEVANAISNAAKYVLDNLMNVVGAIGNTAQELGNGLKKGASAIGGALGKLGRRRLLSKSFNTPRRLRLPRPLAMSLPDDRHRSVSRPWERPSISLDARRMPTPAHRGALAVP